MKKINYVYEIKYKEYKDFIEVRDHEKTIREVLEDVYGASVSNIKVFKSEYSYDLDRHAKNGEVRSIGRKISLRDEKLRSIRRNYGNSGQIFVRKK